MKSAPIRPFATRLPIHMKATCTAPNAASRPAWPDRSGWKMSRARTGRPASASRITCIRPPMRIGTSASSASINSTITSNGPLPSCMGSAGAAPPTSVISRPASSISR